MTETPEAKLIASLMMYARPELADAHDSYWALIRANLTARGIKSPVRLAQEADEFEVWNDPDLVLSQTCGMPYRLWLHDKVTLIGTPDFGVKGCPAGYYRSAIIARAKDPRTSVEDFGNAIFAYNQTFSQSGYAAPFNHLKPRGIWFDNRAQTGGHLNSARAVATGRADIAALDAVSWRLIQRYEDFAQGLRVLDWTDPTPGLPYIAASGADRPAIFDAVRSAIFALSPAHRAALGIQDLVDIPKQEYLSVPNPEGSEKRAEDL